MEISIKMAVADATAIFQTVEKGAEQKPQNI